MFRVLTYIVPPCPTPEVVSKPWGGGLPKLSLLVFSGRWRKAGDVNTPKPFSEPGGGGEIQVPKRREDEVDVLVGLPKFSRMDLRKIA